jgi:hypothetical protein
MALMEQDEFCRCDRLKYYEIGKHPALSRTPDGAHRFYTAV